MNGAEALLETLTESGVEVCFANPGTSEMQLVAAIDRSSSMRAVLCLFEGVATGAADGYARIAGKPAVTLLHLGAGLGNGVANLHNARRARSQVVNIVGDHATYHLHYDAPLTSDIAGIAGPVSDWVHASPSAEGLAVDGAAAVAAAREFPGQIATLIVPADAAWGEAGVPAAPVAPPAPPVPEDSRVESARAALMAGEPAVLFLGGPALTEEALIQAARISQATGARLVCETFPARLQRGGARPLVERLPYFGEAALDALQGVRHMVLAGADAPVAFFAYPGKPSVLVPEDAECLTLAAPREDALAGLTALADALEAPKQPQSASPAPLPPIPSGPLNVMGLGAVIAAHLPEGAIVSDEGATAGIALFPMTAGAKPHDWLTLTGGAIGQGLPLAIGAAIAAPDRKVVSLQADGSGLYTVQALWTMAREELDIVTVLINNSSYAILNIELQRVGAQNPGPKAMSLLDLSNPSISWTQIAEGFGVPAVKVETVEDLDKAFADAMAEKGPRLIEAIVP
ncbi:acetolactate synthase large subunit [Hyphococcus luteus]|uniref:Acetolactate synthase large subunit n=1 Tax=Hyphococcus luteus TaxID=2058213 RepID=A0A2S7KAK4_9PROT|nr:acetolactate synthase large subunit [Marinicaulis flavus]PQA89546.1 acetolactate synthase large subunit [Marinicaulis flavus]